MDSSLKKEDLTEGPSTSAWVHRPAAHEAQAPKVAFMCGRPRSSVIVGGEPSSSHKGGVSGSPLPFYSSRMKGSSRFEETGVQSPQQQQQHPLQGAIIAGQTGKRPHTAQLTIFYAGMVNVYDDVPSDKAQAIMLLAGTGSAWSSSNYTNLPGGGMINHPMTSRAATSQYVPHLPSQYSPSTRVPNRQVTTAVELPQARKASLARFLEKRKDRVRKGPYCYPNGALKKISRENSPTCDSDASGKPLKAMVAPLGENHKSPSR